MVLSGRFCRAFFEGKAAEEPVDTSEAGGKPAGAGYQEVLELVVQRRKGHLLAEPLRPAHIGARTVPQVAQGVHKVLAHSQGAVLVRETARLNLAFLVLEGVYVEAFVPVGRRGTGRLNQR